MRTRSRNGLVLGAFVVGLAALGYTARGCRDEPTPISPPVQIDAAMAIPADAMVFVRADMVALRESPLTRPLLTNNRDIIGIGAVEDVCGFDPVDQMTEMAFAIPNGGADGDFGISGAGPVPFQALIDCAAKVIEARGGRPVKSTVGAFQTVRDVSLPTPGGEIASRAGGPVLLAAGPYLRSMVDAAEGRTENIHRHVMHHALHERLGAATITGSFVLSAQQRASLVDEISLQGEHVSPEHRAAIEGISAAGLAVTLDPGLVRLRGLLQVQDAQGAAVVANAIRAHLKKRSGDLALRVLGLAWLLEAASVSLDGRYVAMDLQLTDDDALTMISKLSGLGAAPASPPPIETGPSAPTPSVAPRPASSIQ